MEPDVIGVWDGFIQLNEAKDFEFFVFERLPNFLVVILATAIGRLDDGKYVVGALVKRTWFRKLSKMFYWQSLRTATNEKFKSLGSVNESMKKEAKEIFLTQKIPKGIIIPKSLLANGRIVYSSSGEGSKS
jgi:hypothetical protein